MKGTRFGTFDENISRSRSSRAPPTVPMLVAFLSIGMSGFAPPASSVVLPRAAPPALGKALALRGGGVGEFFGSSWPEVGVTFGTYIAADFLSNFLQHPGQKMDYGFLNKVIGREVDEEWDAVGPAHGEPALDAL